MSSCKRKLREAFAGVALLAVSGVGMAACAAFQQDAKYALDAAEIACIIANAELNDATVAQVCGIADVLIPDLRKVLEAQRASARKAAMSCHGAAVDVLESGGK